MKMNFSKDELAMVYQYAAGTKEDTLAGLKEIVPVIRDRQTRDIVENTIRKLDAIPEPECRRFIADTKQRFTDYDIPPEALDDEVFAAIIKEAEKYLGYPYVWGGSSPSTSFDCSGFVSWVINHSGWDVGRLGAQGLCNICTPVSSANVKPGDLVFFTGTYDTPGVSHVGIYVGNNMMIHCGDPISYANLNSNYWQSHFYRYGRLP